MAKATRIPPLNTLRFHPINDTTNVRYNTLPFDRGFYHEQRRLYQPEQRYFYQAAGKDKIGIYLDTTAEKIYVSIIDCNGDAVADYYALLTPAATLTANVYTDGDGDHQLYTYWTTINLFGGTSGLATYSAFADGIYYVQVKCLYDPTFDLDSSENRLFISEPIKVVTAGLPGTIYMEATNDKNALDILFAELAESRPVVMPIRFDGDLQLDKAVRNSVEWIDQDYQNNTISATPSRNYKLMAGGKDAVSTSQGGITRYLLDKLNWFTCCKTINIQGQRFRAVKGATWNEKKIDNFQLLGADFQLAEYSLTDAYTFVDNSIIALDMPEDGGVIRYPFAYEFFGMEDADGFTVLDPIGWIENEAALTAFVEYLNDDFAAANDLTGTFYVSGTAIYYSNGIGETWGAMAPIIYSRYMGFVTKSNSDATRSGFSYEMRRPTGMVATSWKAIVVWGDGTIEMRGATGAELRQRRFTPSTTTTSYIFHSGEDFTATDNIGYLHVYRYGDDGYYPEVVAGSTCPVNLEILLLPMSELSGSITSVDASFLQTCAASLQQVSIIGDIKAFDNNVFDGGAIFSNNVNLFEFTCSLNEANLNALVLSIRDNVSPYSTGSPGATVLINQTPAQPPTGTALAFLNTQAGIPTNWAITRDI